MSADAFLALPTDILGTDYVVPGWETNIETRGGSMICKYVTNTCCVTNKHILCCAELHLYLFFITEHFKMHFVCKPIVVALRLYAAELILLYLLFTFKVIL